MQIKLNPPSPHPTILFNIALPEAPEYLGLPQAWAAQLHRLSSEELEYPQTTLALDKTAWVIACLSSVTFDLSGSSAASNEGSATGGERGDPGTITCIFIDGRVVEWELTSVHVENREALACVEMLQSVCRDVHDSAVEAERERIRYHVPDPRARTLGTGVVEGWNGQPSADEKVEPKKQGKHKKQRSLLMSLVASLVSPRSFSQPAPPPPPSPPPPPFPPSPPQIASTYAISSISAASTSSLSTILRKRARSTLVDTFRRHVLSKLTSIVLPICTSVALQPTYNSHVGYFMTWVAQSMLERVEAEMEELVREAGGVPTLYMNTTVPPQLHNSVDELSWQEGGHVDEDSRSQHSITFGLDGRYGQTLVDELPPQFLDDTEDDDTDDSSLHTPSDGTPHEDPHFIAETPSRSSSTARQRPVLNKHSTLPLALPRSPSPPTPPTLSPPLPVPSVSPGAQSESPSTSVASSITIVMPQPSFTPTALTAYNVLSSHRLRLRKLLGRLSSQADILISEERALQSALEVKARRRAWSNRDYMGKNRADMRFLGFAAPARRSPLGRCKPICAVDVVGLSHRSSANAQVGGYAVEGVKGPEKVKRRSSDGLVVTTVEHSNVMRLFPVCEEDEEEEDYSSSYTTSSARAEMSLAGQAEASFHAHDVGVPSLRLVEDFILRDAEAGMLAPLPLQRHSVPIRPRTRSMIGATPSPLVIPPLSPTADSDPPSPLSTTSSFTVLEIEKLEFDMLEPQTKVELFDTYEDEEEVETSPGEMGFKSEFTLSMDLPPPYRMGIGMHAMTRRYDTWVVGNRTTKAHPR